MCNAKRQQPQFSLHWKRRNKNKTTFSAALIHYTCAMLFFRCDYRVMISTGNVCRSTRCCVAYVKKKYVDRKGTQKERSNRMRARERARSLALSQCAHKTRTWFRLANISRFSIEFGWSESKMWNLSFRWMHTKWSQFVFGPKTMRRQQKKKNVDKNEEVKQWVQIIVWRWSISELRSNQFEFATFTWTFYCARFHRLLPEFIISNARENECRRDSLIRRRITFDFDS